MKNLPGTESRTQQAVDKYFRILDKFTTRPVLRLYCNGIKGKHEL